jgi:predicted transcriptional regulator of viral defense system
MPFSGGDCRVCRPTADKVDTRPDVHVAALAARQWGVISATELRRCGLSRDAIATRVRDGHLHRFHRGVYVVGHANPPLEACFLAAVKACGKGAVLSHFSAAALWDLVRWDGRDPEVSVVSSAGRARRGILVHRGVRLDPTDVRRRRGIPVTSPARALADVAASLGDRGLRRAVREAQARRLVDIAELTGLLRRLGRPRGSVKLTRIVATGPAPTRSELEDIVLDLILVGGFEHPDVNVPLVVEGRRVVPDFRWPRQHLVVEADGGAWHDNKLVREDDAERQALLESHGERIVRVSWDQALSRPRQTLARFEAAGAPRADGQHAVADAA